MADLTTGRRPIDDTVRALKRRRLTLDVAVLKTDILRREIEIEERYDQIGKLQEEIEKTKNRVVELEQLLEKAEE